MLHRKLLHRQNDLQLFNSRPVLLIVYEFLIHPLHGFADRLVNFLEILIVLKFHRVSPNPEIAGDRIKRSMRGVIASPTITMTVKRAVLSATLAIALGLEILTPSGGEHPHVEKDVIAEPETVGAKADALRPVVTLPENPWLIGFTLRVTSPEELRGWWVNTKSTTSAGLVTVGRTQTCGEARFNEPILLRNPNLPQGSEGYEVQERVYLNEDYSITLQNRKTTEQIQLWLAQRGVTTQLLYQEANDKGKPPDLRTPLSNFAPVYSDADGVTEMPT
jgi:hypothetical protein